LSACVWPLYRLLGFLHLHEPLRNPCLHLLVRLWLLPQCLLTFIGSPSLPAASLGHLLEAELAALPVLMASASDHLTVLGHCHHRFFLLHLQLCFLNPLGQHFFLLWRLPHLCLQCFILPPPAPAGLPALAASAFQIAVRTLPRTFLSLSHGYTSDSALRSIVKNLLNQQ